MVEQKISSQLDKSTDNFCYQPIQTFSTVFPWASAPLWARTSKDFVDTSFPEPMQLEVPLASNFGQLDKSSSNFCYRSCPTLLIDFRAASSLSLPRSSKEWVEKSFPEPVQLDVSSARSATSKTQGSSHVDPQHHRQNHIDRCQHSGPTVVKDVKSIQRKLSLPSGSVFVDDSSSVSSLSTSASQGGFKSQVSSHDDSHHQVEKPQLSSLQTSQRQSKNNDANKNNNVATPISMNETLEYQQLVEQGKSSSQNMENPMSYRSNYSNWPTTRTTAMSILVDELNVHQRFAGALTSVYKNGETERDQVTRRK